MATRPTNEVVLSDQQFQAIARAIADPRRFAIFQQVAASDGMPCSALNEHDVLAPATISHHMKELNDAGLITIVHEGRGANLFLCRPIFQAYIKRLASL